jgi:F-type H+-transporting ATPase subunit gamma
VARARAIVKRRKAVRSIRKITRTMQLIATARFQQAHNRAVAGRPYVTRIRHMVGQLSEGVDLDHPLLRENPDTAPDVVLVLTSNRGLAGGYNSNVLRAAVRHIDELTAQARPVRIRVVGKKGIQYFKFLGRPLDAAYMEFGDKPTYAQVSELADQLMAQYAAGEIRSVSVAYMRFVSTGSQRPEVVRLLPMEPPKHAEDEAVEPHRAVEWEFSPDPASILADLLPEAVRVSLYQCFLEAVTSEQVARMVAMKAATDAAGDMIKFLSLQYNRARQTQITLELLDIVGGANALQDE